MFLILHRCVAGGAPLREAPRRGGEDPPEISGPSSRHRREGPQGQDRRPGQEEIPRAIRPHRRTGTWALF
jgi:hypothetical protein